MTGRPTWLVVAHGSRNPELSDAHAAVCAAVAEQAADEADVAGAYLELTEPSIPDAIDAAVAGGADHIVLVPYFLHVGNHTRRDLPAIVEAATERHPHVRIEMAAHLGLDARLVDLVVDRAREGGGGGAGAS